MDELDEVKRCEACNEPLDEDGKCPSDDTEEDAA